MAGWWGAELAEGLLRGNPALMNQDDGEAGTLNLRPELDLNNYIPNDDADPLEPNFINLTSASKLVKDCSYFTEISFINRFKDSKFPLLLNLNICSLQAKYHELSFFLNNLLSNNIPIDIIGLQEVWKIGPNIQCLDIPGFQSLIYKSKNQNRGGGVGFYIKSGIAVKIIDQLSVFVDGIFESLCIELIYSSGKTLRVLNIYRPPGHIGNSSPNFFDYFLNLLGTLSDQSTESFIIMDSNIDLLKFNSNINSNRLIDLSISHGFINIISKATRINNLNFSLIDQILYNKSSSQIQSGVIICDISDHFMTFSTLINTNRLNIPKTHTFRDFSTVNLNRFKNSLSNLNWNHLYELTDADLAFNLFWETFNTLFQLHFPLITKKFNKNFHKIQPFMTAGLLTSRRNKLKLHLIQIKAPTLENKLAYKRYRNIYNILVRQSKLSYFSEKIVSSKDDPKLLWKTLNEALNRKQSTYNNIDCVNVNNELITNPKLIANSFNNFFADITSNINSSIPPSSIPPEYYVTDHPDLSFDFNHCCPEIIIESIRELKPKKHPRYWSSKH